MEGNACRNCRFYIQHYGLKNGQLFRVHCGHCTFSRARRRKPDTAACENFQPGETDEEAFVTRTYLSKELLRYVLDMELLPEIKEFDSGCLGMQHS